MALLGTLSIMQAWFLPGFLFLFFFKKIKVIDKIIISLPLSLVLNYLIVYILVIFKIYIQQYFLLIIFFEILLLLYFFLSKYGLSKILDVLSDFFSLNKSKLLLKINFSFLNFLILFLFIIYSYFALSNLGKSINLGDPIGMWNVWAISWAENIIPKNVEYPQAVPILYSISYKLINTYEVEFFTRAICLIYPLWIFIIFFRLVYLFPKYEVLIKLTLIITTLFVLSVLRNYALYIGYSDTFLILNTTAAGFIFLYDYYFRVINRETFYNLNNFKYIVLISLIASAPAITKQNGLLISFAYPLIFFFIGVFKKNLDFKNAFSIFVIIFFVSLTWYCVPLYRYFLVNFETAYFLGISEYGMQGTGIFSRLGDGLHYLFWEFKYIIILLILISLKNKISFVIFSTIVLPYFLIWSIFYATDNRNFLMVSPFLGFILSIGIVDLKRMLEFLDEKKLKFIKLFSISIAFIFFILSIQVIKNDNKLLLKSIESKKIRGNRDVNVLMYSHFDYKEPELDIISVPPMDFNHLPIIGKKIKYTNCKKLLSKLQNNEYKNSFYLLINRNICSIKKIILERQVEYSFDKQFVFKNIAFYKVKK